MAPRNPQPQRGEIWIIDLGYVGKTRPALILSIPVQDHERALVTYVPCTTKERESRFEVDAEARFFRERGVFDAQAIGTISAAKLVRKLGSSTPEQLRQVEDAVKRWLGFQSESASVDIDPPAGAP